MWISGIRELRDEVLAGYPRSVSEIRQHLADYYAMISHVDDAVGLYPVRFGKKR